MKHCQKDQLLEATLPSHDFISSLMIFSAFIRASASQLLNLGCKLFKNQTKTKPSFPATMFSEKKPKNITFNNSQTVKNWWTQSTQFKNKPGDFGSWFPTAWPSASGRRSHERGKCSWKPSRWVHRPIWEGLTHLMDEPPTNPLSPSDNLLAKGFYKQAMFWCSQAREESFKPEARRPFAVQSNASLFSWKAWMHT